MSVRTLVPEIIPESTTWKYTGKLEGEGGEALGSGTVSVLELTLYNQADLAIINTVDRVNILNTGRGTLDVDGNLAITFLWQDNPIVGGGSVTDETHIALIEWTYGGGLKKGKHELAIRVRNLAKVP
jgi:hypothetical protein